MTHLVLIQKTGVHVLKATKSKRIVQEIRRIFLAQLLDSQAKLSYVYSMLKPTIRNSAIYYSRSNNKVVRVTRTNKEEKIAYVKHHNIELANEEVFFNDLEPVSIEQVKKYLGRA